MNQNYPSDEEVAERIRRLRAAEGFPTCSAFAQALDVDSARLNNVENGAPLGKELAFRMVQRVPGLTTDWLWFGRADALPLDLRRRLDEAKAPARRAKR